MGQGRNGEEALRPFFDPMHDLSRFSPVLPPAAAALEKVSGVFKTAHGGRAGVTRALLLTEGRGRSVAFEAVCFGYRPPRGPRVA